jgi:hypothetical protein
MVRTLLFLVALFSLGFRLSAGDPQLEYQVKAVCVLNAARLVSWPADAFAAANSPLVIGVLGDNPFGSALDEAVKGETVRQRPIVVRRVGLAEAAGCHLLFVCRSERDRLDGIFQSLGNASVLTISEIDRFTQSGGMIGLALEAGKIRFEVNPEAASRRRLRIDAQFLRLARITK